MSEENVAIVRDSLEHFAATDEFLNVIAPDFVWDMGNRVLALLEQSGKPHGSDALVHLQYGLLHTVRDRKLRRIEAYASFDEALQAAGLAR